MQFCFNRNIANCIQNIMFHITEFDFATIFFNQFLKEFLFEIHSSKHLLIDYTRYLQLKFL